MRRRVRSVLRVTMLRTVTESRSAILAFPILMSACTDGRPEVDEATAWFRSQYPLATVSAVRISEDEVVSRSFRFQYQSAVGQSGQLEIQFMRDSFGRWIPSPEASARLPALPKATNRPPDSL